jgi:DNA-directed RNA polymerase subunit omega
MALREIAEGNITNAMVQEAQREMDETAALEQALAAELAADTSDLEPPGEQV